MINFPEIDLKNENTKIIIFFMSLIFFFINSYDIKIIVTCILIVVLFVNYEKLNLSIKSAIIKKNEASLNYNNEIETILKRFKKYKKKSPYNYKKARYYWKLFIKTIDTLEKDNLYNYNHYFDNAEYYLQESINIFQGLGVESYDRKYIEGLKYNDFENSKELMKISKLSKQLYDQGYNLLYSLSLRLNKKWKENPNIFTKEIVMDYPRPNDKSLNTFNFYF